MTMSRAERPNWFSKFVIVSETLKKSIASQDQANHLRQIKVEIKVQSYFVPPRMQLTQRGRDPTATK